MFDVSDFADRDREPQSMKRTPLDRIPLPCTVPESTSSPDLARAVARLHTLDPAASASVERRTRILDIVRAVAADLDPNGCDGFAEGYARCVLHEDPTGWSLAAIVLRPGQTTPAHDHGGWGGAVTVQGVERDRRFRHAGDGRPTLLSERDYPPGAGYLFAPDDVHQPLGADPDGVTVALHFLARPTMRQAQHHHEGQAASAAGTDRSLEREDS
jgi:predicted metal-dependent enzyme (double-stranded beta helix superfamily)